MPGTYFNYIVIIKSITIDVRELQKQQKNNKRRQKGARGTKPIVKGWDLIDFVVHLS